MPARGPSSLLSHPWTRRRGWDYLGASCLWKHTDVWQVVVASCWNSDGWQRAGVSIHRSIYRLARQAKVNARPPGHLNLNSSLLLWNFPWRSHDISRHRCVYSAHRAPQINLQFWLFTVDAALVTNGRLRAQHYSFAEECLEECSEAKGSDARPIFWFAFIQSTSTDSLPLTELLLSGNFARTKNKTSSTIPSFWRKDALGLFLVRGRIQSVVTCSPLPPTEREGQPSAVWRSHPNPPNTRCELTPIFILSWMSLCTLQVCTWGSSVSPTSFDLSVFSTAPLHLHCTSHICVTELRTSSKSVQSEVTVVMCKSHVGLEFVFKT